MALNPCAACKFMKVECSEECVLAQHFPSNEPEKFDRVHKVFGVENVSKILNVLSDSQRENAVQALSYEAEARIQDPVHGYVGTSLVYENHLKSLENQICSAKNEITSTMGPEKVPQYSRLPTQIQEMGYGCEAYGASTSAGPSVAQQMPPLPQNQNQP